MSDNNDKQPWPKLPKAQLTGQVARLSAEYKKVQSEGLSLDLTRGKPGQDQVELSSKLDGILKDNFKLADGTETRNYGGILGIPEARKLGAEILEVHPEEVLVGGNSSLTLMYQYVEAAHFFGLFKNGVGWREEADAKNGKIKFLCPVPGYDRHFTICEALGIGMIAVPMTDQGPDMSFVEAAVKDDLLIKGIWCVPRFSNPSGVSYSAETVDALARLPAKAGANFRILWDNAYAVHNLYDTGPKLECLLAKATEYGHEDNIAIFASTSKITFAGGGISWLATSKANLERFTKHHGVMCIGPDKVNQLRHVRLLPDLVAVKTHMRKHAALIQPKFRAIQNCLEEDLTGLEIATWTLPEGGYFVSFDCLPGLAKKVVALSAKAGVKLTPAGATWPYGKDPRDSNIRIAPSFPSLEDVKRAISVFTLCVRLATAEHLLNSSRSTRANA